MSHLKETNTRFKIIRPRRIYIKYSVFYTYLKKALTKFSIHSSQLADLMYRININLQLILSAKILIIYLYVYFKAMYRRKTVTERNSGADTTGKWTSQRPGKTVSRGGHIYPTLTTSRGCGRRRISVETRMTVRTVPGATLWIRKRCWKAAGYLNAVSFLVFEFKLMDESRFKEMQIFKICNHHPPPNDKI